MINRLTKRLPVSETVKSKLYKPGCNNLEENKTENFKLTQEQEERKGRVNQKKSFVFEENLNIYLFAMCILVHSF